MATARETGLGAAPADGRAGVPAPRSRRATLRRRLGKSWQVRIGGAIVAVLLFTVAAAPFLAVADPTQPDILARFGRPSHAHPFGTDNLGRDIFSQIVYGSRISLSIGLISVGIAAAFGITLGLLAGFYRRLDNPIMRVIDVLLAFPGLLLAIAIVGALGPSLENAMIAVGIATIPGFVRIVRSAVLRVGSNEYVDAARAVGVRDARLLVRYVLPNVSSEIIVTATLGMASAILFAAALSFLGLGAQPPKAEWGSMVAEGTQYFQWWWIGTFPGLAIFTVVLAFNFLGDSLRDVFDPRTARRVEES